MAQVVPPEIDQPRGRAHLAPPEILPTLIGRLALRVYEYPLDAHNAVAAQRLECGNRRVGQMHGPAARVLGDQYREGLTLEIHVLPFEPNQLALPDTGGERP